MCILYCPLVFIALNMKMKYIKLLLITILLCTILLCHKTDSIFRRYRKMNRIAIQNLVFIEVRTGGSEINAPRSALTDVLIYMLT